MIPIRSIADWTRLHQYSLSVNCKYGFLSFEMSLPKGMEIEPTVPVPHIYNVYGETCPGHT